VSTQAADRTTRYRTLSVLLLDDYYSNDRNLTKLATLGHFLKGSSATLGVWRLQESCEKIQRYGQLRDEETDEDLTDEEALRKIRSLLGQVKQEYEIAETWLKNWYAENSPTMPSS
jgi:HPt (histidine-containing phosphotransfer) domain-containing protein